MAESTQTGIGPTASYLSCLPYWLEEYRNEQLITKKATFLRGAFNRASASKGIKAEFGTRSVHFRACLMICGEDTPNDAALLSRCVVLSIDEKCRKGNHYDELQNRWTTFSSCFVPLIQRRAEIIGDVVKRIRDARQYLRQNGVWDDRTAWNWSIPIACYSAAVRNDPAFLRWAVDQARVAHLSNDDELAVNRFLTDLSVMLHQGRLDSASDIRVDSDRLYVRSADAYAKWLEHARRLGVDGVMKQSTIEGSLKDIPGYMGKRKARVPSNACASRCYVFDLNHRELPDAVRQLANLDEEGDDATN